MNRTVISLIHITGRVFGQVFNALCVFLMRFPNKTCCWINNDDVVFKLIQWTISKLLEKSIVWLWFDNCMILSLKERSHSLPWQVMLVLDMPVLLNCCLSKRLSFILQSEWMMKHLGMEKLLKIHSRIRV